MPPKKTAPAAAVKKGATPKAADKKPAASTAAKKKDDSKPAAGGGSEMSAEDGDRILRNSIDHEAKIRDQIAALTGKLEGVLNKPDSDPGTAIMDKIIEENKNNPKRGPKKKVSLKDGPKRTISVQLPPEIFEKIQQDELRDEMERNHDLKGFMADQGLEEYTEVLKRRGFKNVKDLSKLEEADIDFKVKPVHKTRLLWLATTQKMFLTEDGETLPDVEKQKVKIVFAPTMPTLRSFFSFFFFFLIPRSAFRFLLFTTTIQTNTCFLYRWILTMIQCTKNQ
jgi:predicted DNA-binding antitoxin AbrB/MazE fold protein